MGRSFLKGTQTEGKIMVYIGKNEKFLSTLSLSLGPEFTGIYTFDPEGGR
jgi:hypothetical protein